MTATTRHTAVSFRDTFDDDRAPGTVVGSTGPTGMTRRGVDAEKLMSIDHGAVRLRPLARPGWGRESVAYGPFPRLAGLTVAARVLNGHNSSQTYYSPESGRQRLRRIVTDARKGIFRRRLHFENLAVGWFDGEAPTDPLAGGNAFVMHAANRDNGELWAAVGHRSLRATLGVQNLDIVYVISLRDRGGMYYAMTTPGAAGLGDEPFLRPLALDVTDATGTVYAGVAQRILGEVGYRVDTRVSAVCADVVEEWTGWYGSASVADRMTGDRGLGGSEAERGGRWRASTGMLVRTTAGTGGTGAAVVEAPAPVGLVHVLATVSGVPGAAGVVFRAAGDDSWTARVGTDGAELVCVTDGMTETVAAAADVRLVPGRRHSVQVTDDGHTIGFYVDGRLAFERWATDDRLALNPGVGVELSGAVHVNDFEAHPRRILFPHQLDAGAPWTLSGDEVVIDEHFDTEASDLDGVATPSGGLRWERTLGPGVIELPPRPGARVRASTDEPNPDRTIYTVGWPDPSCADVEIELVPPGAARHQGENCRVGAVFWQDPDNYLIANIFLDDVYDGASVSTFYHLGGHEDMYDAVWSLVWPVLWATPCRLRVAFDGLRFLAWHDGKPVLQRALTDVYPTTPPIRIHRVGVVVNEEWGNDTGSRIISFRARRSTGAE